MPEYIATCMPSDRDQIAVLGWRASLSCVVHGERGGKVRLPSMGLGDAVRPEMGTSEAVLVHSNVHAAVFVKFPSAFTTTEIVT